jgi:DMSO/TMAO reductase YedYZ heme-binding membrane subunit
MSPGIRKFALAAHLTVSIGWFGAVAAYLALDVTVATSQDLQTLRAAYLAMELIARFVIVPLAVTSLLTGIVMSLGTKWGLFRHYWVLISLVLTVVATAVLLVETRAIRPPRRQIFEPWRARWSTPSVAPWSCSSSWS